MCGYSGSAAPFASSREVSPFARDLGMHPEALRLAIRRAEADASIRADHLTTAERERLKPPGGRPPRPRFGQRNATGMLVRPLSRAWR